MKPPLRARARPTRFGLPGPAPGPPAPPAAARLWTAHEKRMLIRGLRAQAPGGELRGGPLCELLPRRREAEIMGYIRHLKGRVAREAVQTEYRRCQAEKRRRRAQVSAPIEVWTDLAQKLSERLEEAVSEAFSQVLTIAAIEPVSVLHSLPPRPLRAAADEAPASPEAPRASDEATSLAADTGQESEEFTVSFEKIYRYLYFLSKDVRVLKLTPGEAAVVLDLLLSLPEEVSLLDCDSLRRHLHRAYKNLMAPAPALGEGERPPGAAEPQPRSNGPAAASSTEGDEQDEAGTLLVSASPSVTRAPCSSQEVGASPLASADGRSPPPRSPQDGVSEPSKSSQDRMSRPPVRLDDTLQPLTRPAVAVSSPVWKDLGLCPLNLFLVPLHLLARGRDGGH